tara:strand:- start:6096 stop:6524 length:429 start_codon:yes stop_codon:yes gene_type:complete
MNIRLIEDPCLRFIINMKSILLVFFIFFFNTSSYQERSEIIKSKSNRDFKIYLNAQKNIVFFEFCDPKKFSKCDLKIISFDLRGIVRLLDENLPIGATNVLGNGKIIRSQTGNLSIESFQGVFSEKVSYSEFISALRSVFFR